MMPVSPGCITNSPRNESCYHCSCQMLYWWYHLTLAKHVYADPVKGSSAKIFLWDHQEIFCSFIVMSKIVYQQSHYFFLPKQCVKLLVGFPIIMFNCLWWCHLDRHCSLQKCLVYCALLSLKDGISVTHSAVYLICQILSCLDKFARQLTSNFRTELC